jgi:hypothetical protein
MFYFAIKFQGSVKGFFNLLTLDVVLTKDVLSCLKPGKARGTGDSNVAFNCISQLQVFSTERQRKQFIDVVGRGRAAAKPVRNFSKADSQVLEQFAGGKIIFTGRSMQRTTGVVGILQTSQAGRICLKSVLLQRFAFFAHLFNPAEYLFNFCHILVFAVKQLQLTFGKQLGAKHQIFKKLP